MRGEKISGGRLAYIGSQFQQWRQPPGWNGIPGCPALAGSGVSTSRLMTTGLGIAALEDKIVQAAVVAILAPIYEAEFLGFGSGFRPKRNQHQALDALAFGIGRRRINWVLDCDVQSFFDKVSQSWLMRSIEHRIGDRRIIRLIAKWLTAGVLERAA